MEYSPENIAEIARIYGEISVFYKLVEEGIARHFPKPDYKKVSNWPATFPIIGGEINSHRQNYKKLPVRMKWTNRETPEFFKDAFSCPKCFAIRPISVCDDSFCYYSQK